VSKPLGFKCYGSIPHFSFSRLGPSDHYCNPGHEAIATQAFPPKWRKARVIVQIKLDGSNVGVARIKGELVPLVRAGYTAISSPYEMHRVFHDWATDQAHRFEFLKEGERLVGEWLAQAHGTRYRLPHDPFVPFDLFTADNKRVCNDELRMAIAGQFSPPFELFNRQEPLTQNQLKGLLTAYDLVPEHGELEPVEGAVYRVEMDEKVQFLIKYVRAGKVDGKYLGEHEPVWNWKPSELKAVYQP